MVAASQVYKLLEPTVKLTHMYDLVYLGDAPPFLESIFCKKLPALCIQLVTGFAEYNDKIDNFDRFPDKVAHIPAGAGWRSTAHYEQVIKNKRFQRWDFGKEKNLAKYG